LSVDHTARIPVLVENLLDCAGATNHRYDWLRKKNTADARRQGHNAKLKIQVIRALAHRQHDIGQDLIAREFSVPRRTAGAP
jgi:hypothetical protein